MFRQLPPEQEEVTLTTKALGRQALFSFTAPDKIPHLHKANAVLKRALSSRHKKELESPEKKYIFNVLELAEVMEAKLVITEQESKAKTEIFNRRKKACSGKRAVIKGKVLVTTAELRDKVKEVEAATQAKKAKGKAGKAQATSDLLVITESDSEQDVEEPKTVI